MHELALNHYDDADYEKCLRKARPRIQVLVQKMQCLE